MFLFIINEENFGPNIQLPKINSIKIRPKNKNSRL